jgi:hypothetical protein
LVGADVAAGNGRMEDVKPVRRKRIESTYLACIQLLFCARRVVPNPISGWAMRCCGAYSVVHLQVECAEACGLC